MTMGGTTRVATRSLEALPCADDAGTQKASSARITQLRAKADTTIASNACNQVERNRRGIRSPSTLLNSNILNKGSQNDEPNEVCGAGMTGRRRLADDHDDIVYLGNNTGRIILLSLPS